MKINDDFMMPYKMEEKFEWQKWVGEIPFLALDPEWQVKIIPPFGGAVARFVVVQNDKRVSVYLDCYDKLGCVGEPYWEIYPAECGNTARFLMHDTKELIEAIKCSLKEKTK